MNAPILVRVFRGSLLEAVHRVALAVVKDGILARAAGEVDRPVYYRSGAKPIQALAVVESGAADEFGLTPEEIAAVAGSHNAEEMHVRAARSILAKAGVPESALLCGAHPPAGEEARDALAASKARPGPIHNNCSGKHAGMLAAAKRMGAPLSTYLDPSHPLQRRNRSNVALFSGVPEGEIVVGIDGCSAPVFGVPLVAMARSFARFAAPPADLPPAKRAAAIRIRDAIAAHPEMVAGSRRNDTELMAATGGALLTKIGAEGLQLVGVRDAGVGIALKVEDGNSRAYHWVLPPLLRSLGLLDERQAASLGAWADPVIRNWRNIEVGRVEIDAGRQS